MSFVGKVFRDIKRGIIILLVISIAGSVFYSINRYGGKSKKSHFSMIIDSDAGNGIDDLFALSRILADPECELVGITASQWDFTADSLRNTANLSYETINSLLKHFKKENIPVFKSGDPIDTDQGNPVFLASDAARFIIRKAHEMKRNRKLVIITLGSLTNPATAILMDSSIAPKISIYALAMKYSSSSKVWNKNEENVRNDLDALDILLDKDELEIHFMPVPVAESMVMDSGRLSALLRNKGPQWDFLMDQWAVKYPLEKELPMPGLALVGSYLKPGFVKVENTNTPPENRRKMIHAYTWINKDYLADDYLSIVRKNINN